MKARHPHTGILYYFVDKCLPFGARASCYLFQEFSNALQHIIEQQTGKQFQVTNYLDDFLFVELGKQECDNLVSKFLSLCTSLGCPFAPNKTEWATQHLVFLGLMLNGDSLSLSIPEDKCNKALDMLRFAVQSKKVKVKFIQALMGTLNFLSKAIIPGQPFIKRMYDMLQTKLLTPLCGHHHVYLDRHFRKDCEMWIQFLSYTCVNNAALCRPFVDVDQATDARNLCFYTDASGRVGFGGIFNNSWIVGEWGVSLLSHKNPA